MYFRYLLYFLHLSNVGYISLSAQSPPSVGDLLLSEILYRPESSGAEFVEVYNASDEIIDLGLFRIYIGSSVSKIGQGLLRPNQYWVITNDSDNLNSTYPFLVDSLISSEKLPRLTDGGKLITLRLDDSSETIIDSFSYSPDLHSPLLDDDRGVSLERIDFSVSHTKANWHSCIDEKYYATPTKQNSVFGDLFISREEFSFYVSPVISPNGDGNQDEFIISVSGNTAGYFVSAMVINLSGQPLHSFIRKESLSLLPAMDWSPIYNLTSGHYFIVLEVYNDEGFRKIYRFPFAVVR